SRSFEEKSSPRLGGRTVRGVRSGSTQSCQAYSIGRGRNSAQSAATIRATDRRGAVWALVAYRKTAAVGLSIRRSSVGAVLPHLVITEVLASLPTIFPPVAAWLVVLPHHLL